jgi:hypothetical protein
MEKFMSFFAVLRKGSELADSGKWKQHQVTTNMLGGFFLALIQLMKGLGYDLPVDENTAMAVGGGVIALVNVYLTAATSKRAGVLPAKAAEPTSVSDTAVSAGVSQQAATPVEQAEPVQSKPVAADFDKSTYFG